MDNNEFGKQFEERTRRFGNTIINLSVTLSKIEEGYVIKKRILRSI